MGEPGHLSGAPKGELARFAGMWACAFPGTAASLDLWYVKSGRPAHPVSVKSNENVTGAESLVQMIMLPSDFVLKLGFALPVLAFAQP